MTPPRDATADELRRQMDGLKVVPLRKGEARADAGEIPPAKDFGLRWADDIALDLDDAGLVDGLFASTGLSVIYGEPAVGKSFLAVDMACRIAAGMPWHGLDVEGGTIVYVAPEGPGSVERRVSAWRQTHAEELAARGVTKLPVLVVERGVDLVADGPGLADTVLEAVEQKGFGAVRAVFVDTWARVLAGADENSAGDVGKAVAAADALGKALGAHVILLHHAGKDGTRGARGSSALRAAVDTELEVVKASGISTVTVRKCRDDLAGRSFAFKLDPVALGRNKKRRLITAAVAVAVDPAEAAAGPARPDRAAKLPKNINKALEALQAALGEHATTAPPEVIHVPPETPAVRIERWREKADAIFACSHPTRRRRTEAFDDASKALCERGLVTVTLGWAYLRSSNA